MGLDCLSPGVPALPGLANEPRRRALVSLWTSESPMGQLSVGQRTALNSQSKKPLKLQVNGLLAALVVSASAKQTRPDMIATDSPSNHTCLALTVLDGTGVSSSCSLPWRSRLSVTAALLYFCPTRVRDAAYQRVAPSPNLETMATGQAQANHHAASLCGLVFHASDMQAPYRQGHLPSGPQTPVLISRGSTPANHRLAAGI